MSEFESAANQIAEYGIRSGECGYAAPKLTSGKDGTIRQQTETCSSKHPKKDNECFHVYMYIPRLSDARKKYVQAL